MTVSTRGTVILVIENYVERDRPVVRRSPIGTGEEVDPPGVASMEGRAQRRSSLVPIIHGLEAPSGNGFCNFWKEKWQR